MSDTEAASIFVEDNAGLVRKPNAHINLLPRLNTNYVDVSPEDMSLKAKYVRLMAPKVAALFTPRKMIAILRILKGLTFVFICLTLLADILYIIMVNSKGSAETKAKLGGTRDLFIRFFGFFVAVVVALIEIDHSKAKEYFSGFKPFVTRGLLIAFVSILTNTPPIIAYERRSQSASSSSSNSSYNMYGYGNNAGYQTKSALINDEIPRSTLAFQSIASWMLLSCAVGYFIVGVLCFDRFTSKAFVHSDPSARSYISPDELEDGHHDNRHQRDDASY